MSPAYVQAVTGVSCTYPSASFEFQTQTLLLLLLLRLLWLNVRVHVVCKQWDSARVLELTFVLYALPGSALVWRHAGIADFIDTALDKGAAVGIVAGTCSIPEEQILTAALFALGQERSEQVHTFVCSPQQQQQQQDAAQQDSFAGLSLEQGMAAARARVSCCACCCKGICV